MTSNGIKGKWVKIEGKRWTFKKRRESKGEKRPVYGVLCMFDFKHMRLIAETDVGSSKRLKQLCRSNTREHDERYLRATSNNNKSGSPCDW